MQKTLTFKIDVFDEKKVLDLLKNFGSSVDNANEYVKWSFKGSAWTAIMYTSGKLVVQTSDLEIEEKLNTLFSVDSEFKPHIGSDEVGKGDYFGPLVVCACFVEKKDLKKLEDFGVGDSKGLSDSKIWEVGKELESFLKYEVRVVSPKEYASLNEEYGNVSIVLSKLHIDVVKKLYSRAKEAHFVVIDQFSKNKGRLEKEFDLDIPLKQYHKAESDIAVACGSILARYFFLLEFEKMKEKYDVKFPLGATHVIDFGKKFYKKYGMEGLEDVAKVSFRTTKKILKSS